MINKDLFFFLRDTVPGLRDFSKTFWQTIAPDIKGFRFLQKGYAMEYYKMKDGRKKVSWFWGGEREFIIPSSPYSDVELLTDCEIAMVTYGQLIKGLKEFEESREIYRKIRQEHNQRIAERINNMKYLSPVENYAKLLERKAWVFKYAEEEDIASYLGIGVRELEGFRKSMA